MLDEAIEYLKQLQLQVQVCGAFSKTCIVCQQKDSFFLSSLLIVSWISYNLMLSTCELVHTGLHPFHMIL